MITTPEQFKEITGFEITQNSQYNFKLQKAKHTYINYLRQTMKIKDIIAFTGLNNQMVYRYLQTNAYNDQNLLSLLNGNKKTQVQEKKVRLFEALDILHKHPKHKLWDKVFRTWTKDDFKELERLRNNGKA